MSFEIATRKKAKLRLALAAPAGGGKTYSALLIAQGLGGKIGVIDTERGSASLYAHLGEFYVSQLAPPYTPERFIEIIKGAESAGIEVLIIDSITHEWAGQGGCREAAEQIGKAKFGGNVWSAFSVITPRHRAFIDAMLSSNMHIIATMRTKTETAQTKDQNGKTKIVKLGMKSEQRDGIEYEFTTVLDLTVDGNLATSTKDRTGLFAEPFIPSVETGQLLKAWLETGAIPAPVTLNAQQLYELQAALDAANIDAESFCEKSSITSLKSLHPNRLDGALNFLKEKAKP